jgi:hypothetical protein
MYQNLLIGVIFVTSVLLLSRILGAWVHSKPRKHRRRKKHSGRVSHAHEYHPYESVSCEGSCEALRYMKGRRWNRSHQAFIPASNLSSGPLSTSPAYRHHSEQCEAARDRQ